MLYYFSLFCRLAHMMRMKKRGLGTNAKLTVTCLAVIVKAMDLKFVLAVILTLSTIYVSPDT